jgi:hypothetical protein
MRHFFFVVGALVLLAAILSAQPPAPPPPAKVQVVLRYRIAAARDQHVVQYDAMIEHLRSLDFEFDPPLFKNPETDREDRSKNYLRGTVASSQFLKIFDNSSVASLLVMPEDFEYPPKELEKIVRVRLELAGGFNFERQRELADQVKAVLYAFNFREAYGYDHHGYSRRPFTRLVGAIPRGRLEVLLKDLRGQPAGWFAPRIAPQDVPLPLRNVNPIQIVEIMTDTEPIAEVAVPLPRSPDFLEKISPDLWALVEAKGPEDETVHVELVFAGTLAADDPSWRTILQEAVPTIFVEGQLGQVVSAIVNRSKVKTLAALAPISTVRLARPARVDVDPALALAADNDQAVALAGLDAMHKQGFRGQGVRLAILDTDFRGWAEMVKKGKLPAATRLVDLTIERDPDLYPAPPSRNAGQLGHGTHCALAAALAAPEAELSLVRLGAAAPYQIDEVIRSFRGGMPSSPYLDRRRDELVTARAELTLLRAQVLLERRIVLESFVDETDLDKDFGFLGPVYGWVFSPRTWSRDQVAYVERLEKALKERNRRFFDLVEDIRALKGVTLVANPLVWNDGVALGAASPLSRALDRAVKSPLLWFQAAGNTRGQTWAGLYHDEDGNGFMEFTPPGTKLKKGQWTTELNFLAWQPFTGARTETLPQGARLRISLQWREPHDPDYYLRAGDEDLYRKPLADLRLSLLRQRDPEAKALPADSFDLVGLSSGVPQRLEHLPGGSIYEVALDTTLDKAGRYAVRVERPLGYLWFLTEDPQKRPTFAQLGGLKPTGLRPLGVPTLPALEKNWELQPRLFVEVLGTRRLAGRPVFADFATDQGSVGSPGDARSVITVGAADRQDKPRPYSAGGPLAFAELATKPTLLAYDGLQVGPEGTGGAFGTSVAAPFAAGTAATLMSAGMSRDNVLKLLKQQNGRVLKVPAK